jgi:hypothetical protein
VHGFFESTRARPIGFLLLVPFSRALAMPALICHEKEQNLPPPSSFSRNDSPAVSVSETPNLPEVCR